jgi:hypothetical protein
VAVSFGGGGNRSTRNQLNYTSKRQRPFILQLLCGLEQASTYSWGEPDQQDDFFASAMGLPTVFII